MPVRLTSIHLPLASRSFCGMIGVRGCWNLEKDKGATGIGATALRGSERFWVL